MTLFLIMPWNKLITPIHTLLFPVMESILTNTKAKFSSSITLIFSIIILLCKETSMAGKQ